ncbi:hypothetical protein [Methylosinus sp. PW1]|uniref:hypothetical protein n=1 Tax=Methylosinus sp. PW1 TaxID=107636 RepID=UPI0018DD266A|nr:hypothetical protein [Methylosinus sp. PW1]
MTLNNSMSITPRSPTTVEGERFEHGSVLGGKTRAAWVSSQWKSTGGVGNQILTGKARVGNCYPLCREASGILPASLRADAALVEYADCTQSKEHSRRDDRKIDTVNGYILPAAVIEGAPKKGKKAKDDDDAPATDQMRIRMELLSPGVRLHTWISIETATEEELGCLVAALRLFADAPHIGGQSARGYGLVDLDYTLTDRTTGAVVEHFVTVADGACMLSPEASEALAAYGRHVGALKETAIAPNGGVLALLEGAA